jgi:hypothetical protein
MKIKRRSCKIVVSRLLVIRVIGTRNRTVQGLALWKLSHLLFNCASRPAIPLTACVGCMRDVESGLRFAVRNGMLL